MVSTEEITSFWFLHYSSLVLCLPTEQVACFLLGNVMISLFMVLLLSTNEAVGHQKIVPYKFANELNFSSFNAQDYLVVLPLVASFFQCFR